MPRDKTIIPTKRRRENKASRLASEWAACRMMDLFVGLFYFQRSRATAAGKTSCGCKNVTLLIPWWVHQGRAEVDSAKAW